MALCCANKQKRGSYRRIFPSARSSSDANLSGVVLVVKSPLLIVIVLLMVWFGMTDARPDGMTISGPCSPTRVGLFGIRVHPANAEAFARDALPAFWRYDKALFTLLFI